MRNVRVETYENGKRTNVMYALNEWNLEIHLPRINEWYMATLLHVKGYVLGDLCLFRI